jgi:ABC-2 type transport system permease protein
MSALVGKELRQVARDRTLFAFIVYIFTLHLLVTTSSLSWELRRTPVVVVDRDHSAASRELAAGLRPPYFSLAPGTDPRRALAALDSGEARLVLEIPEGFERSLTSGAAPARVQVLVDGAHVTLASLAASYTAIRARTLAAEYARARAARLGSSAASLPVIESRQRTFYNFTLDDHWPGSLAMLLTMLTVACIVLPAAAAVREKERGTIEQLLVAPLTPLEIMLSKILSMVLVSVTGTALAIYVVMQPAFEVPLRGSAVLFFALTALFAFANSGIGLFLSTLARNSAQVGLLVILTMLPIIELSGTFTPMESMPRALAMIMNLSPLKHFVEIAFAIALRGEGAAPLWKPILWLAAVGSGWFLLGLWRFRRQFS